MRELRDPADRSVKERRGRGYVKYLFLVLSLLIVAAVLWYLKRPYGMQSGVAQTLDLLAGSQGALVTDIHLTQFDDQRIRWTLDAPSAQRGEGKLIVVHHPRLGFSKDGNESIVVTADQGDVDGSTGKMVFSGRVEAGDEKIGRLWTEQLRFDPDKRILYTDQMFRLERLQMRLEGEGLTLTQETQTLTVDRHVRMTFPEDILITEQP